MKQLRSIPVSLWIFICLIHSVYFVIALQLGTIYTVDSPGYLHQAANLLNHHSWYAEDWNAPVLMDYFSFRPPLYACFIIICKSVFSTDYFILFVQNLISVCNILLLFRIFHLCGFNRQVSMRALMLVLVFYPAQFIHANLVMTEIIFQGLLLLIFYYTLKFRQSGMMRHSVALSLLLGISLLTKPVVIMLGVLLVIVVIIKCREIKRAWPLVPFLFVPLVFHLICLQNKHSTGYYHFSSVKPVFHLKYNAKYTLVSRYGESYADSSISAQMRVIEAQPDYGHRYELMQSSANEIIKQYPLDYMKIYIKGLVAFFIDPGRYDLFHLFGINDSGFNGLYHEVNTRGLPALLDFAKRAPLGILFLLLMNLFWNVFVSACFIWFLFHKKAPVFIRILVFVFVAYIGAATGVLGLSRYRVPVYPLLSIAVVFAINNFYFARKYAGTSL